MYASEPKRVPNTLRPCLSRGKSQSPTQIGSPPSGCRPRMLAGSSPSIPDPRFGRVEADPRGPPKSVLNDGIECLDTLRGRRYHRGTRTRPPLRGGKPALRGVRGGQRGSKARALRDPLVPRLQLARWHGIHPGHQPMCEPLPTRARSEQTLQDSDGEVCVGSGGV